MPFPHNDNLPDDNLDGLENVIDLTGNDTTDEDEEKDSTGTKSLANEEKDKVTEDNGEEDVNLPDVDGGVSRTSRSQISGTSNTMGKFTSPFYTGPTIFGGNSANNRTFNQENQNYKSSFLLPTPKLEEECKGKSAKESNTSKRIREILDRHKERFRSHMRESSPYERPCSTTTNSISAKETNMFIKHLEKLVEGRLRLHRLTHSSRKLMEYKLKQEPLNFLPIRKVQKPSIAPYSVPGSEGQQCSTHSNISKFYNPCSFLGEKGFLLCLKRIRFPKMANLPKFDMNIQPPPNLGYKSSGVKQRRIFIFNPPVPLPPVQERQRRVFTFVPPLSLEEDLNTTRSTMMTSQNNHPNVDGADFGFGLQFMKPSNGTLSDSDE